MLVQHGTGGFTVDAPVVEALRQTDEVSREAIAADVRHLPGPLGVELVPQSLVQRPSVAGAARIVLAVRADEEERVPGRAARPQVDAAEILVGLELEARQALLALPGRGGIRDELRPAPAIGSTDEEEPAVRNRGDLVAEVLLDLVREPASRQRVARPEPSVLDQEPVIDPAGGRSQRLVVLA